METIIPLVIIILMIVAYGFGRKHGFEDREDQFQSKPIDFQVGDRLVLHVSRKNGGLVATVWDKKYLEIVEGSNPPPTNI